MFQGYSNETFEFFMAIRFNNNTDFFHSNHDWYLRGVRQPSLALAEALGPAIEALDPDLERRPNRVVSRINRDLRFSKDKTPYRDYIWLSFHQDGEARSRHLELYFSISASGADCGMGYYRPERELLNALRLRIRTQPERVLALLAPLEGDFSLWTNSYKRMPVPDCVPEALHGLYRARALSFQRDIRDFILLKSPALVDQLVSDFQRLTPMYRYLSSLVPVPDEEIF